MIGMNPQPGHRVRLLAALLLVFGLSPSALADESGNPEASVCIPVLEPLMFWLWNRSAGEPPPIDPAQYPGMEIITHLTADGRLLRGYRLPPPASVRPKGFLLVAQGNATLAEDLFPELRDYARSGHVVYVFNYRGYANSEGRRRLKAIVGDYREIFAALARKHTGERLLYGQSFDGIVLLNVIGAGARIDRAVIDSTPSHISQYSCPTRYNPIANVPAAAAGLLAINGRNDRVVPAGDSAALLDAVEAAGGRALRSPDFAHPFMDKDPRIHRERRDLIQSFLLGSIVRDPGNNPRPPRSRGVVR